MPRVVFCPTSRLSSCPRKVQVPRKRLDSVCYVLVVPTGSNKYTMMVYLLAYFLIVDLA